MNSTSSKKIYPKKSLGQNYLTDENICRNIVNSFEILPDDFVIEIGSGQGAITKYIIEKTKNFIGVEFDKNNYNILKDKFPNISFTNEDFLKYNLNNLSNPRLRIIGNIPYNITSEILFKLIDNRRLIKDALIMTQEEVAQRLAAKPNSKEYGITSVFAQTFSEPKVLFKVSKNCFYPKPKIDSRIIHFDFTQNKEGKIIDAEFFRKFVRAAFSNRRKTLKNSLSKLELDLSKINFDFKRRAESLSVDEFIELSNKLS